MVRFVASVVVAPLLSPREMGVFAVAGMLYLNAVGRRHVSFRVGLRDWRRIGRFGLQMFTIGLAGNLASRMSDLILGRIVGLAALGLYSRASGLNGLLWENVHLVIGRIVFVDFVERRRRSLPLADAYLRIVAMITGLLWPAFVGLAILAGPITRTLYGDAWVGAALPLSMLCLASAVLVSVTMASEVYIACGETDRQVRYELKRTALGFLLFTAGCFGGLATAAAARVAEAGCTVALVRNDLNAMTGLPGSACVPIFVRSALLTLLACAPALCLLLAFGWSPATPFPAVLAAVALGGALWGTGLWGMGHPLFTEAMRLARRVRGRG